LPTVSDPVSTLGDQLADARRSGESFETAWPDALAAALGAARFQRERYEWANVLADTIGAWRSAFERRAASAPDRALRALAEDPDRVACGDQRACAHCVGEIPAGRDPRAVYCSSRCRHKAHYLARVAA
jgi:hypothetical protein